MKKSFFILLSVAFLPWIEKAQGAWSSLLQKELPAPLQKIKIKKTTLSDVKKLLGKPDLIEKQAHYYQLGGFKYSLQIIYEKNVVKELAYTFFDNQPLLRIGGLNIDLNHLSRTPSSANQPSMREYHYSDKEGDLTIDLTNGTIQFVRIK